MCIPPINEEPHKYLEKTRILRDEINPDLMLSMGMSNDYDIALSLNSNLVELVQEYLSEIIYNNFFISFKFKFCC